MNYTSFKDEALADINTKMNKAMELVVLNSERVVKKTFTEFPDPPIDTGTLRRSIAGSVTKRVKNESVTGEVRASTLRTIMVTNLKSKKKNKPQEIEYAKFVEYGTVKMPARPFMRQGLLRAEKSNNDIIRKVFKQ